MGLIFDSNLPFVLNATANVAEPLFVPDDDLESGHRRDEREAPGAELFDIGDSTRVTEEAEAIEEAIETACARIAPLWPLRNFVAVNPYQGLADRAFPDAMAEAERLFHARGFMPARYFAEQLDAGRIDEGDLREVVEEAHDLLGRPELEKLEPERLLADLLDFEEQTWAVRTRVQSVADLIDLASGTNWSQIVEEEISRFCAARFDAGQAAWKHPFRERSVFAAWLATARLDPMPELLGIPDFRSFVASLPEDASLAIATMLDQLAIGAGDRADFLTRQLTSLAGWAGHARQKAWDAELAGGEDDTLRALLAIRLAFDCALAARLDRPIADLSLGSTNEAESRIAPSDRESLAPGERSLLWQVALERHYRKHLVGALVDAKREASSARPLVQAAFCIDVRSEILRRQLESQSDQIETIGFAGFFGVAIEAARAGEQSGSARCPVLLSPAHKVRAEAGDGDPSPRRLLRARARHDRFLAMRKLVVGAFPIVETVGGFFGVKLLADAFGWSHPHPGGGLFPCPDERKLAPGLEHAGEFGIPGAARVDLAESILRNMGLVGRMGRVVLLCGHGGTSVNNPHASSLDCGACGGHAGDVNARVAARILNDTEVRAALDDRGLSIPTDTRFVAGLHDTTRDRVELLDVEELDPALRAQLSKWLETACSGTRAERAPRLGEGATSVDLAERLDARANDWSEVRPEWGLAGNAAFIAAPRSRTRGVDLGGRAFLHDYDAGSDPDGAVLELILTAPLVVATWINTQYYASTVDNDRFGAGDKALHNVVSRHGVMLGNRSDLRTGLPWQSVHDGERFVHEPLRLTAIVEAPRARIARILSANDGIRTLVENGWIELIAWDGDTDTFARWQGGDQPWVAARLAPGEFDSRAESESAYAPA